MPVRTIPPLRPQPSTATGLVQHAPNACTQPPKAACRAQGIGTVPDRHKHHRPLLHNPPTCSPSTPQAFNPDPTCMSAPQSLHLKSHQSSLCPHPPPPGSPDVLPLGSVTVTPLRFLRRPHATPAPAPRGSRFSPPPLTSQQQPPTALASTRPHPLPPPFILRDRRASCCFTPTPPQLPPQQPLHRIFSSPLPSHSPSPEAQSGRQAEP